MKAAPTRSTTLHGLVGKASVRAGDWDKIIAIEQINDPTQRTNIILAFVKTPHSGQYSPGVVGQLQSRNVKDCISAISSTIRSAGHPDPCLDADGKQLVLLYRQYHAYAKIDKPTKKHKAITAPVMLKMKELASSPLDHAIAHLVIGAFFFAMRSCEYSTVSNKDTKMKRLCLRCIRFFCQ